MGQAGHGFVGNQQLRLGCHSARQLELAHLDLRQIARHVASLVVKPDQTQQLDAAPVDALGMQRTGALMHGVKHGNAQVVGEIEAYERARKLEASRKAAVSALVRGKSVNGMSVEMHLALLIVQRTADTVNKRTFARTVRPNQPNPLALLNRKLDAIQRDETAEAFADIADVKERTHLLLRALRRSCTRPTTPFGAIQRMRPAAGRQSAGLRRTKSSPWRFVAASQEGLRRPAGQPSSSCRR